MSIKPLLFIATILRGTRRTAQILADDLLHTIEKAHLGKLPAGVLSEQFVSVKRLSRDALRAPLTGAQLAQMDRCVVVHAHEVSCLRVSCKTDLRSATACYSVSVYFRGELSGGEPVVVDVKNRLVYATIVLEDHVWRLSSLLPLERFA